MYWWDTSYIILIPAIIFALWAQLNVKFTFGKYSDVRNARGLTGYDVARTILDDNGLTHIQVERVSGNLTDHYDPRANVIRLSDSVYSSNSIAAVGVAAHEAGHALQYSKSYAPIKLRNAIIPVTRIGSNLAFPLVIIGLIFSASPFITIGIILYVAVVIFQAVTLPVEFNASGRALDTIKNMYILDGDEVDKAKKVLTAAALTYVAALFSAILSLLRLIVIANRRN